MNKLVNFIKNHKQVIIYCVSIIVLYVYYLTSYAYKYPLIDSDTVSTMLMAQDILNGNFLLKEWYGSTRNWIIEVYLYNLLPYAMFGMDYGFYYYYPPIIMVLIMASSYLLVYRDTTYQNISYSNIFLLISLLIIPFLGFGKFFIRPSHHNETYVVILLILILIDKLKILHNKRWYYPLIFILTFVAVSDTYAVFIFVLPMLFILMYRLLFMNINKKANFLLFIIIVFGTIFAKIIEKIVIQLGGITYNHVVTTFAQLDQITERIGHVINNILFITNSNFFGLQLNNAIFQVISFFILIFLFSVLIYGLVNFNKFKIVDQFLILAPIVIILIYIFSSVYIGAGAIRYYVIIVLYLILLTSRIGVFDIISKFLRNNNIKHKYVQILLIIMFLSNAINNIEKPIKKPIAKENEVVSFLLEKNLTNGYASFWNSNIMSLLSNNQIKVNAISNNRPYLWLSKESWYKKPANFILATEREIENYKKIFNDYSNLYEFDNITIGIRPHEYGLYLYKKIYILEFDYDISKYFGDNSLFRYSCNNCNRDKDKIILQSGEVQYGPYITLDKGIYKVTITGDNLDKVAFDTYSLDRKEKIELNNIKVENNLIEYTFRLDKRTKNIEHRIFNNKEFPITIKSIVRQKIE